MPKEEQAIMFSSKDIDEIKKQFSILKGRLTRLTKRVDAIEELLKQANIMSQ